jgi:hypothetical protein
MFWRTFHRGRVRHSPVSLQGLPGPYGAYLACSIVADSKDKIQLRRSRVEKFVPTLTPQTSDWKPGKLKLEKRGWVDRTLRMGSRAVSGENRKAPSCS